MPEPERLALADVYAGDAARQYAAHETQQLLLSRAFQGALQIRIAVEVVFAWPGIGQLVIQAADREDFPVLQAGVIVAGAFVVLSNLVVDTFYRVVDRRLQVA